MNTFGESIAAARKTMGFTQADLADAINDTTGRRVTNTMVSNWETGLSRPGAGIVVIAARILGLDEAKLSAMAGVIHPETRKALLDPEFAAEVEALRVHRLLHGAT